MVRFIRLSMLVLAVLAVPAGIAAQDDDPPSRRGGFEIAPFVGGFNDEPEFGPDDRSVFVDPESNPIFGTYLGYHFPGGFFLEAELGLTKTELAPEGEDRTDVDLFVFGGDVGYNVPIGDRVQLFPVIGIGAMRWSPDGFESETDFSINYGGGARIFLTDNIALRLDGRMHQASGALAATSQAITGTAIDETMYGWTITAGLSFLIRGRDEPGDADRDGVSDDIDACPNTPPGDRVDARGCTIREPEPTLPPPAEQLPPQPDPVPEREQPPEPPAEDPAPPPVPTFADVLFALDSSELDAAARRLLDDAGRVLGGMDEVVIVLHGHTDSTASEVYNDALGERRAEAVRDYLLRNFSVLRAGQFRLVSFGERMPVADNGSDSGRRLNRRVEITVGSR